MENVMNNQEGIKKLIRQGKEIGYILKETLNKSKYNPLGAGNHQTRISAGIVKRIPISKYGGKYCIAGLAITKPKPKTIGTSNAINISLVFIFLLFNLLITLYIVKIKK